MENLITALILSVVEGVTEFLPVSSTGHLILVGDFLKFTGEKAATFDVVIQLGAILSVVCLYWKRFFYLLKPKKEYKFSGIRGIWLLFLTTLPACILGLLLHSYIKKYLFSTETVIIALIIGAICMIIVEKKLVNKKYYENLDDITPKLAFGIGCFQCIAMWPGFSRSAATIMGAMFLGANRKLATEYSFIAAVPVMVAATGYDILKNIHLFSSDDILFFVIGMVGSFISALIAIKFFVKLVASKTTLIPFAIYRFILAILVILVLYL